MKWSNSSVGELSCIQVCVLCHLTQVIGRNRPVFDKLVKATYIAIFVQLMLTIHWADIVHFYTILTQITKHCAHIVHVSV